MIAAIRKPRALIEDIRRRELIEAAHRVFMQHGLPGLTTSRICAEAGLSPGILTYYFKGKHEVLFAMVRMNNRLLSQDVAARLRTARTPWDRLTAIIEGNFPDTVYEPNVARAWLSTCAAAGTTAPYARLQRIFYLRLRSNLAAVFGSVLQADQRADLTLVIGAMIDGLWLRRATETSLSSAIATRVILATVTASLGQADRARMSTPFTSP